MPKKTAVIHIIEDEPDIVDLLEFHLSKKGYNTSSSRDGEMGLEYCRKYTPDLLLLDLMLPGIKGLDVCKLLKTETTTEFIPIIMVTALGQESDIVKGLNSGADDYVIKPFNVTILMARISAVLRRSKEGIVDFDKDLLIKEIKIQPRTRTVSIGNFKLDLTFTEFQLLYLLASHPGWVFTRYQIIDKIRGDNYPVTDRSVDFQIVGLRKKLGEYGKLIETIRGVGYRFQSNET
tara:strand:+ start:2932 stop:3633 length:702 start_codon:yes stop_codon:yes gene_type:complete